MIGFDLPFVWTSFDICINTKRDPPAGWRDCHGVGDYEEARSFKNGKTIVRTPETVTESMDGVQKGGYPHFMLIEIHEQAQAARELTH